MNMKWGFWFVLLFALQSDASDGPRLEHFDYPFPVSIFKFTNQGVALEMAYMDVKPQNNARGAIVLLHGKNFSGAYWGRTAASLSSAGYRVIMPDQIGFGKSTKPEHYQFTFQQLALNTRALLHHLGVEKSHMLGHSMGGMVATRYALMFPTNTQQLLLIDPLGLEDWKAKGVPYSSIDENYQTELHQTAEKLRQYEKVNYYGGHWKPDYEPWVTMLNEFITSPEYPRMARVQALTSDMIFTQPVCYEFTHLQMPVLLVVGSKDRTAIGRDRAPAEIRDKLGNYPKLGRETARQIPHCKLVELEGLGHLPHVEDFETFIDSVTEFLNAQP